MTPPFDLDLAILMAELSVRSYRDPEKFKPEELGLVIHKFIEIEKTHTQVYLLVDDDRLFVAFRGSESLKDVVNDLMIIKKRYPPVERWWLKPRVHHGFLYTFQSVKESLFKEIQALQEAKTRKIYVTGHSLGASLAVLTAFDLKRELNLDTTMYNYGCPRIGNRWFIRMYNRLVKDSFRIVNDDDFITTLPKFFYRHVQTLVYIYDTGELLIKPNRIKRIFERLDNLIAVLTGDAIIDHLEHNYLEVLQKIKELQSQDH